MRMCVGLGGARRPAGASPVALPLRLLLNRWELDAHHPFKLLLDAEFDVEHAGAIGFGAIRLEMTAI